MIIVVASGKGGTGKTTVAASLALTLMELAREGSLGGTRLKFGDCDVEEPNAALFLKPRLSQREEVSLPIPQVDPALCTYCGRCAQVCQYHAIAVVAKKVLVFPELCHGCGSCTLECPEGAIQEVPHVIGIVEKGRVGSMAFAHGLLDIGAPAAPPIIRRVKSWLIADEKDPVVILDAPPGTSCPVVQSLRGADYALMVTEPTPFGLHDLALAVEVARGELSLPVGVVINRDGIGDQGVDDYCRAERIPILMRIPMDRRIAEAYSRGEPLVTALPEYRGRFVALYEAICEEVSP
ncbi:MAG: (4Fe-4S)-binding protein [Chloroflexi bacterium]|nr:(4Fe-4S)-binding protein [Chloroflexota bacterium]